MVCRRTAVVCWEEEEEEEEDEDGGDVLVVSPTRPQASRSPNEGNLRTN